jgi:hypothetical protein
MQLRRGRSAKAPLSLAEVGSEPRTTRKVGRSERVRGKREANPRGGRSSGENQTAENEKEPEGDGGVVEAQVAGLGNEEEISVIGARASSDEEIEASADVEAEVNSVGIAAVWGDRGGSEEEESEDSGTASRRNSNPRRPRANITASVSSSSASPTSIAVPRCPGPQQAPSLASCPICGVIPQAKLLAHIKGCHNGGVQVSERDARARGLGKCHVCARVFIASGPGRTAHMNRCTGAITLPTSQSSQLGSQGAVPIPSPIPPPGISTGSSLQSPPSEHARSSQSLGSTHQGAAQAIDPHESPTWADGISPDMVLGSACIRKIPKALISLFREAVRRTGALLNRENFSERALLLLMLLPRACLAKWAGKNWRSKAKVLLRAYPYLPENLADEVVSGITSAFTRVPRSADQSHLEAVKRHIEDGSLGKGARALLNGGLVEVTDDVVIELRRLHPEAEGEDRQPFVGTAPPVNMLSFHSSQLASIIQGLDSSSAPGPSGWTFAMIKLLTEGPEFFPIYGMIIELIRGELSLRDWFTSARLIPLAKSSESGGGVRPIAVGEAFTRIAANFALERLVKRDLEGGKILDKGQFGVCSKGGVEPLLWWLNDAAVKHQGVLSLDFKNAFNTVSRRHMAEMVREKTPHLWRLGKFLYGEASSIFVLDANGKVVTVKSECGVKQGDPLGPLFFSLAIQPIIAELRQWTADPSGACAYLDDGFIRGLSSVQAEEVLDGLEGISVRVGLSLNRAKCRFVPGEELHESGFKTLGSFAGGPASEDNGGARLVEEAAARLEQRILIMRQLPLQHQLLLLRKCFYPQLNHLLRSLPPAVSGPGASRFDKALTSALEDMLGVPCLGDTQSGIMRLPAAMGGLGLVSQARARFGAAGSSLILSNNVLRARGSALSDTLLHSEGLVEALAQCADSLELPVSTLLSKGGVSTMHLQQRCAVWVHEQAWREIFDGLGTMGERGEMQRKALAENGGRAGRAWLEHCPTEKGLTLTDEQTRYGLCKSLLLRFKPRSQCGKCKLCGLEDSLWHHLACWELRPLLRYRHDAVRTAVAGALRQVAPGEDIREEVTDGSRVHDILLDGLQGEVLDVGITAVFLQRYGNTTWPVEEQEPSNYENQPDEYGWDDDMLCEVEDLLGETALSKGKLSRAVKFRLGCVKAVVGPAAAWIVRNKHRSFEKWREEGQSELELTPMVLTAGGGVHGTFGTRLRKFVKAHTDPNRPSGVAFAAYVINRAYGLISAVLVRYGTDLAKRQHRGEAWRRS